MAIFNSLGSNYTFPFALRAVFARNTERHRLGLLSYLEERYGGKALLVYKGREAIRLALRVIGMSQKYTVGICGYTCFAVYDAVVKEGYSVRYLDIDEDDLHYSFETVKKMIQASPSMRILILQNTLGYPADIAELVAFCREREIIIIEDLAHCIGAKYINGQEAGTVGDFTVLSFSQDKTVDGVSGGALVVRNDKFSIDALSLEMETALLSLKKRKKSRTRTETNFACVELSQQWRDRMYPLFTWLIRKTYTVGVGKILHLLLKRLHLLSMPMNHLNSQKIFALPAWYCALIYSSFRQLDSITAHRRKIASIYADKLPASILSPVLLPQISVSANLRFPLFVEKREELIRYLKDQEIFVSDIWYDSPIAPKKYLQLTDYTHQCPNSERVSELMVNLPTHINVSEQEAMEIAKKVTYWVEIES
jgi:dTDP-4-amino-4,6-dideoxygalactose transaminase